MEITLASFEYCTGCQACKVVCPKFAITMVKNIDGFLFPSINQNLCIKCHNCEKSCPAINNVPSSNIVSKSIVSKSKNDEIRFSSSSGGVFSHFAEYIINAGGYVVGVVFTEDFHSVKHVIIDDVNDISLLRGSKYLQSDVSDIYQQVKNKLNEDKYVLFSGTGCQIAALRSYLNKEYEKLFLVDIVCHGVPSQDFWSQYLNDIEAKHHGKANSINFRFKKLSLGGSGLEKHFGKNVYFKELKNDPYLEIFQRNLSLRESCFHCKYKSVTGIADISIGDLWGADELVPDFNDNKGISFMLIHSNKGLNLFNFIKDKIFTNDINLDYAIAHNRNIAHPSIMPDNRKQFFADLNNKPFSSVLKKYTCISNKDKVKNILDKVGLLTILKQILSPKSKLTTGFDKNLEYGLLITFDNK